MDRSKYNYLNSFCGQYKTENILQKCIIIRQDNLRKEMSKKIIINLKGGLGNQLFQLSAGITLVNYYNLSKAIIYTCNLCKYSPKREFELIPFLKSDSISYEIITKPNFFLSKYFLIFLKYFSNLVVSDNFTFKSLSKIRKKRFIILDGYFQKSQFVPSSTLLELKLSMFNYESFENHFENIIESKIHMKIDEFMKKSMAIHIRGKDYLSHSYYAKNNYDKIITNLGASNNAILVVFTDDHDYTSVLFQKLKCNNEIIYAQDLNLTLFQEFYFLSKFIHIVISNSTFALFAALIGNNNKEVHAPRKWVKDIYRNDSLVKICNLYNFIFYDNSIN